MLGDRANRIAIIFCFLFVALGCLWVGELGIQNDEALFAAGIYPPMIDTPQLFGKPYPAMVMTYVGALKSYVYAPVFRVWRPSAASTRVPAVLLAGLTIWLFYRLARRTAGLRTALAGTALLATDSTYLITSRYDWGPVVLQHLCMTGGMLAVLRFAETRKHAWVGLGFFLFGLGLWDKALFAWSLVGLGIAVLAVFPRRCFELLRTKAVAVAILGFMTGAFPLIHYNATHDWVTFRSNTEWSTEDLGYKARLLLRTLQGDSMLGTLPREDWERPIRPPDSAAKRVWIGVTEFFGSPRRNWQGYLLLVSVLLLPFVWNTRAKTVFLFVLIYSAVTWGQMAFLKNGGTGTHHPVLLWPMPHLAIAAVLAAASEKWTNGGTMLAAAVSFVCFSNLLVTGTYYSKILLNGGTVAWSDAIFPASQALPSMRPSQVCVDDWGFFETIRLLHRGRIPMCVAVDADSAPEILKRQIADPNAVYIGHVKGAEFTPGSTEKLLGFARSQGYSVSFRRVFSDYNGRPIIELFKLAKGTPDYTTQIERWRRDRETRLKAPDGWLSVAGLTWLKEGDNLIEAGTGKIAIRLKEGQITHGTERLRPDSEDFLSSGGMKLFAIHRGNRYGIRIKDNNSEFRRSFTRLNWYPVNPSWRVTANYSPYAEPRKMYFDSQTGDKQEMIIPGIVEFKREGKIIRLTPVLEENELFFVFRDLTARETTYPAARFLYAEAPGKAGPVELDFNKAYNPPCAFTPYATCPLPPKENRLAIPVEAGEKRYFRDESESR